ncbi:MAG: LPS export ABC transporter permease LptG [Rhodospirillales bacterium]|nr:LPS export ABC transporter permease LptG [Rhodospirillales bacterium]
MRISPIMSIYVGRQFLLSFITLFIMLLALVFLFDIVELLRRASSKSGIGFALIIELALLKLPKIGNEIFPFSVLFAGMVTFWRLTRSHELVVTRAAGISVWQFLAPCLFIAFFIGLFQIGVFNPLSSVFLNRFEQLEAKHLRGQANLLAISQTGLWLRQSNLTGQSVVHSTHVLQHGQNMDLTEVTIFAYRGADKFIQRIEAETARLEDGFWHLKNAWLYEPEAPPVFRKKHLFETDLTITKIQDSFAPPETLSFWDLPSFIKTLEDAGFSAIRHRLHWHSLLAAPLLLCAMILIAATFTLRQTTRGSMLPIISGGILSGFLLYFFSDLVFALGLSDSVPVILAAWTPSGVSTLLGLAMLLHLEDG